MDKEKLLECRDRLNTEKKKLLERYLKKEDTQHRIEEEAKEPGDWEDMSQMTYTEELLDNLSQREIDMLKEIDVALKKIENGTYGICEGCGNEIPYARLCAIPWTRFCASCAEEYEREMGTYMPSMGFETPLTEDIQIEREDIGEA